VTAVLTRPAPAHAAPRRALPLVPLTLPLVPLALILAAQALLTERLSVGAFASGDEGRYIYAGHQLIYELWHGGGSPYYETFFSGAPVIYSILAAMADHLGGLVEVRLMSLVFMMIATTMLFMTTRRLFGYLPSIVAAAFFAGIGLTQDVGALATYDAMSFMLVTVSAYCAIRTGDGEKNQAAFLLSVPLILFLANATKYVTVMFDPVVITLAALQVIPAGWRRVLRRTLALGVVTSALLVLALFLGGSAYLNGVLFSTVARSGGTSAVFVGTTLSDKKIISESWEWIGVTIAGSAIALLLSAMRRNWREFAYAALFLFAGCLVTIGNLRLQTDESMYKHDDLAAWFACIGIALAVAALSREGNSFTKGAVAVIAIASAVLAGVHYSQTAASTYQAGGNDTTLRVAAALKPYLTLPHGRYLIGGLANEQTIYLDHSKVSWFQLYDDLYIKYPIPGRGGDSHGQTRGIACLQLLPQCRYLEGIAGYRAAIHAHWFSLVSMWGDHNIAQDTEIAQAVRRTAGYVLLTTIDGSPTWIYAPAYAHRQSRG
jgi:4-amino-4-deoxy-L-arabinose transferase-like glycosyltransferase